MSPKPTTTRNRRSGVTAAIIALVFLAACGGSTSADVPLNDTPASEVDRDTTAAVDDGVPTLAGYERDPEPTVGSLSLPAVNGDQGEFLFKADPGELLMVAFGFTNCPDVCPTTLSDARIAFNQLGDRSEQVDLAWVSVDPDRDTAEITKDYVEAFIADGVALRTDDADQLAIAADAFGITYVIDETDDGEIEVGHTPNVSVVDDTGSIILTWPFGIPADDIASDLNILLDRQEAEAE